MADTFRYRAFLSYSHSDEAAATRLHRALEHYTLPRRVRKAHALPRRLIPIFRDVEELAAASGLTTRLQDALDQSQWLIVLCSPAAAQSKYVNQEIEYFLQKHGASRILCALAEGEPPDCFPPAIKALKEEPLAADFRPGKDFELSKLKLIAALAGVGFTEIRSREAQRRKRQQLIAATLLAGISLGGIAYWDLFHREHVNHYVNYVRHHGIWEGVDRIGRDQASRRSENYRFTRNGRLNPPRRVDYVNGSGHCLREGLSGPLGHPRKRFLDWVRERYCSVRFVYREGGELAREDWLNNIGEAVDSLTYTETGLAQFTQKGFASAEGGSGVHYVHSERDEAGLDRRVQFLHSLGNPRQNERHEFGWKLDYDSAGRLIRRSVLDDKGAETGPVTHFRYDEHGMLMEVRHAGIDDRPYITPDGYSSRLLSYDGDGNVVLEHYRLPDGSPAIGAQPRDGDYPVAGFATLAFAWDARGNNVERRRLDADGSLMTDRLNIAIERMTYDERGNLVRLDALDAAGRPVAVANEGMSSVVRKYDTQNSLIEMSALGVDGKPTLLGEIGVSTNRFTYGPDGRWMTECVFDTEGRPVVIKYGACYRWEFDGRSNPTSINFLGLEGRPYARLDSGVARTVMRRDDRGNFIGASHFDANLKPVVNRLLGQASTESTVDDYGNGVELRRFDAEHRLMRGRNGAAIERSRYDRSGNLIEEAYFDEEQRPTRHTEGYFSYRAQYDSRGRLTRREYLDARGDLMKVKPLGAYGVRYEYDAFGAVVAEVLLDADGADGARIVRVYNDLGRETEWRYLAAGGGLAAHPQTGCVRERLELDAFGRTVERRCLDARDRLINRRDGGWAVKKIVPHISGVFDESYFDAAGRPVKVAKQ